MNAIFKQQNSLPEIVKNPRPKDLALIYPQRGFVMTVISGSFWNNGVWSNAKYKNRETS